MTPLDGDSALLSWVVFATAAVKGFEATLPYMIGRNAQICVPRCDSTISHGKDNIVKMENPIQPFVDGIEVHLLRIRECSREIAQDRQLCEEVGKVVALGYRVDRSKFTCARVLPVGLAPQWWMWISTRQRILKPSGPPRGSKP